jgi:hypothetical protein
MSVRSLYHDDIQKAWATVFACAWSCQMKEPKDFEDENENGNHFYSVLVRDPKQALTNASLGKYHCEEFESPSLREAASTIINSGLVLPLPEPPAIDNLNVEQLRQFFNQEGITGIMRHT